MTAKADGTDREVLIRGAGDLSLTKIEPGSYTMTFAYEYAKCCTCGEGIPPDVMHWARTRLDLTTGRQDQVVWCDRHGTEGPPWERPDPPIIQWKFEPFRRVRP